MDSTACVMAIDPGPERSAWLVLERGIVVAFGLDPNDVLLEKCRRLFPMNIRQVAIEEIESFGMAVGREVFTTVRWAGRFEEAADLQSAVVTLVPRRAVKLHLCGSARAKDSNIRQALIDRFGGDSVAVGKKASPGPLYGVSKDVWSALAIAVTHVDQQEGAAA
jgi:hypothetical protein